MQRVYLSVVLPALVAYLYILCFLTIEAVDPGTPNPQTRPQPIRPRPVRPVRPPSGSDKNFGNLLLGRGDKLYATSTCGLNGREKYCVLSELEEKAKCFWCNTNKNNSGTAENHNITNVLYKYKPRTGQKTWWQAENGVQNVTVGVNFETEFLFTHVVITFKTFRPAAMLIEKSSDYGRTWKVLRYFAKDCAESFPGIPHRSPRKSSDVVCESRYSEINPSSEGEVIFRLHTSGMKIENPYLSEFHELARMTNLRLNFTKLHTLGDDLLDERKDIKDKYYYAIEEFVVGGTCSCNGHSRVCVPAEGETTNVLNKVHGHCKCIHNTKGQHCQYCDDFYNDLEWYPAFEPQINACRKCNCNNHGTSCHFDRDVFLKSGSTGGGVCDDCQHNTRGINCETCQANYYHDPTRDIQDAQACQPCHCYPDGVIDEGTCESSADPTNNIAPGQCHCKANVEGTRCDRCKSGFWNFTRENVDGCQRCSCFEKGTRVLDGCDIYTGECNCKRYVTGRDCNQCLPEFFGLSDKPDGCEPCNCNIGGSLDTFCDVQSGQCKCRPHMSGQKCDKSEQNFYVPTLDALIREGELARNSENCRIIIREPKDESQSWSGIGFIRAFETSKIEFDIDDIPQTMEYDVVIDYEAEVPRIWSDASVIIQRLSPVDPNGLCRTYNPATDFKQVSFDPNSSYVTASPPSCLERNHHYKIILEFGRSNPQIDQAAASILIDAIRLIPRMESLPLFKESPSAQDQLRQYESYGCSRYLYAKDRTYERSECEAFERSISSYLNNGAHDCQCNVTGSTSKICAEYGGQCVCKKNIVGHKCDRCVPGTYGFSPDGCKPCDCSGPGALDNFCDVETGQCKCRPFTYGRQCDQCQPGFWNFPNCQRCECNGHADVCDPIDGVCTNCRDETKGKTCHLCEDGYYGDPRIGVSIPCRPCPCPESPQSGHSFADSCSLDSTTKNVFCDCREGYAGAQCDTCAENYFGDPEVAGGQCQKCQCNDNVDERDVANCDMRTGECLKCLYNTTGEHCEMCKGGFHGDATAKTCVECKCNILGTNYTQGQCDRVTGQCPCFRNVQGVQCDQCEENHWKLASGEGCEFCDCDPTGSYSEQCNLYDGQCECKEGFGGRKCDQCQTNFWGNPSSNECFACDCDLSGSQTMQCNRDNGSCVCKLGIAGTKCDKCARGFLGAAPTCSACGECFTNWDNILNEKKRETERLIEEAGKIKQVGAAGAYTYQFDNMENKVNEIENLLNNANISSQDLDKTEKHLDELRKKLNTTKLYVSDVEGQLDNSTKRIDFARITLDKLQQQNEDLKKSADFLKNNATALQEANVEGALKLMKDYKRQLDELNRNVDNAREYIDEAERQCKAAENIVSRATQEDKYQLNQNQLENIRNDVRQLRGNISLLNEDICDKRGDPCDSLCGGAGCDFCGGVSCDEGAIVKVEKALQLAQEASSQIRSNELKAEELLRNLSQIHTDTVQAQNKVELAYQKALDANYTTKNNVTAIQLTINEIKEELKKQVAPKDIAEIAEATLAKNIVVQPSEIDDYAKKINQTLASLSNIREILQQTANDSQTAAIVQREAERLKAEANAALDKANSVNIALDAAKMAQSKAQMAIEQAAGNISQAEDDLKFVDETGRKAQARANATNDEVLNYQQRLKNLQATLLKNTRSANDVQQAAGEAEKEANEARKEADILKNKYEAANTLLLAKSDDSNKIKNRAHDLYVKSTDLRVNMVNKFDLLKGHTSDSNQQEKTLKELAQKLAKLTKAMEGYLVHIRQRSYVYRNCPT